MSVGRVRQGVVLFHSIHALFVLKKALAKRDVQTRAVPIPRHLSSDCGSALAFPMIHADAVRDAVSECKLEIQGVHELEP